MADTSYRSWPFLDEAHRDWARQVETVAAGLEIDHSDTDAACRRLVQDLGAAGLLQADPKDPLARGVPDPSTEASDTKESGGWASESDDPLV